MNTLAIESFLEDSFFAPTRKMQDTRKRAAELKISHLHQGIGDKLTKLQEVARELGAEAGEIAYIGDDVNDLDCIRWCGFTACPADAVPEVLEKVDYVCRNTCFLCSVDGTLIKMMKGKPAT